ncbi:hypothetical protein Taro_027708 [Colocasia esculenta]|uniref:Peptide N-acetyl-beta-D-glucosaminyl asparaginase amidase A N-terminal domain-containing protein n=1 Tax=Colocasia esculenta TaxID=4460 RepID=A0A843VF96_COLES|nr:hypothetical protein [Colocasia esculenta]
MGSYCNSQHTLLFSLFLLLLPPPFANAVLSTSEEQGLPRPSAIAQSPSTSPTTYFQVTRPIPIPRTKPCSILLLQHDFASTYDKPPVTAAYSPPSHCRRRARRAPLAKVVLVWKAACRGRQFDRIFGVWLGGVELLRSCTAEPRATGTVWTVEKDVTRYASLFSRNRTLAVYLGNIVDRTYTGIYHVNITLRFYYGGRRSTPPSPHPGYGGSPADLILPISRDLPPNDGQWFVIENSTVGYLHTIPDQDWQSKELAIPRNAYRAILEVFVSFHSDDESWYSNPNDGYISANNLTDTPGNGPFREVIVGIDSDPVGAVWPFTVIYTGGVNPLLWRPITGIGSFDLPSYDIEITPFLGKLLDGKPHKFGFAVRFALSFWLVDANLHLWLDGKSSQTHGSLVDYQAPDLYFGTGSWFQGLDGTFAERYTRQISSTGWVMSSQGNVTTHAYQVFDYKNFMEIKGNGSIQVVQQLIDATSGVSAKGPGSTYSEQVIRHFPLYLYTRTADRIDESYTSTANVSFGFYEKRSTSDGSGSSVSSLANSQKGEGEMVVKGNLVVRGVGSTKQVYRYESTSEGCYLRNVSSSNYTILFDEWGKICGEGSGFALGESFRKWVSDLVGRIPLVSHLHSSKNRE